MFKKHYDRDLLAYCHGELTKDESRRLAEHLLECQRCRQRYEEVKSTVAFASGMKSVPAPTSLWSEIDALLDAPAAGGNTRFELRRTIRWKLVPAIAAVLIAVATGIWYLSNSSRNAWIVDSISGDPKIGSSSIGKDGRLVVGQSLETDGRSSAKIEIPNIGQVDIDPNSRIRLIQSRPTEHRMELQKGTMHATISAPPRLFFVNTPSAEAIDLGCKYTLNVDEKGAGLLTVELGWVSLVVNGRESIVPVGAMCATRPGVGPGTPYFHDAPQALKDALNKFDFENGGIESINTVLSVARERDAITLWHLLFRLNDPDRERVYDRLVAMVPLPPGVTKEGVLRLDRTMMDHWRDEFEWGW